MNLEFDLATLRQPLNRIGFLRSSAQAYVFTNRPTGLVTKIGEIAQVLNKWAQSGAPSLALSAADSITVIQCLDSVYRIVDRHNSKIETFKKTGLGKIFALHPFDQPLGPCHL